MTRIYEELINFIARGTSPAKVAEFSPSQETKDRVADLIHREKIEELTEEELSELNHYLEIERFESPDTASYDRYTPRVYRLVADLVMERSASYRTATESGRLLASGGDALAISRG